MVPSPIWFAIRIRVDCFMNVKKPKRGRPFEEVVAEVVPAIDPRATVRQGKWTDGPDGRRDRDVSIDGTVNGAPYKALVECKDYDRETTGPVGIGVVDALDSKRRDLGVQIAIICSNAGFTEPATRKAKRVGIVLIGLFRQTDGRIRHQLIEQVYFRRLKIEYLGFSSGSRTWRNNKRVRRLLGGISWPPDSELDLPSSSQHDRLKSHRRRPLHRNFRI